MATVDELRGYWNAGDQQTILMRSRVNPLAKPTPEDLRAVSRSFGAATAETIDGLHSIPYAMLLDEGLEMVGSLRVVIELLGACPAALRWLLITMLPKPQGVTGRS